MTGRVLVTGATGGFGRVLVARLVEAGHDVLATGRDRAIGATLGVEFRPADLVTDDLAPLFDGVGTVHHLAALSAPWGPEQAFVDANLRATERLLKASENAGVRRFVFASTPSIYTRAAHQIGLTEASPLPPPVNAYARTKYAAERAVLSAGGVALRPRAIICPHDTVLLPRLLRAAKRGVLPLPGHGRALIEPTDARDAADAFIAAADRAEALGGQAFNLSGGQPVPLADLSAHVFARLGIEVRTFGLPARLALALARLTEAFARSEPSLTRYSAMALGWSQTFDLTAARSALGWEPAHSPFEAIDWALGEMGHA